MTVTHEPNGALISAEDLYFLAEGKHLRPYTVLGAHPMQIMHKRKRINGVRFAAWAPNAKAVSVVGDFNAWNADVHRMHSRGSSGVWECFVPDAQLGQCYKFDVLCADGVTHHLKADPYARAAQLPPETASVITDLPAIKKLPTSRGEANSRDAPISIYELHSASWRQHADGSPLSWAELANVLPDYVAELGFTHIELMPITEYPYGGSWGYQPTGLYAPTARHSEKSSSIRFGSPHEFAAFVRACHDKGVGVLLDWVPAHFPADAHGLAQFDGTALYEYADPREGFHRDWNTLIYNYNRYEVRNFLAGSALYWLERFGVDGLRVDAVASMLYRDYSRLPGEWIANAQGGRENLEAISLLKQLNEIIGREAPGCVTIAEESTAFPQVSAPTYAGGLGFHYKWNMGWMNDTLQYMREDPIHRRWHHHKMSFGLSYAFSENFVLPLSHDEVVHGKGTILGRMPGDEWQRFANLRAYYGFMWGHPGKKLLFMGQEFAQATEWNHNQSLPWQLLDDEKHKGVQRLVHDLNMLYRKHSALHQLDCEAAGSEWIDANNESESVFSWLRKGSDGTQMMVICNFTPVPRHGFRVGVPKHSVWKEVLNTDAVCYGGSGQAIADAQLKAESISAQGRATSIVLTLPPLATIFLSAQ